MAVVGARWAGLALVGVLSACAGPPRPLSLQPPEDVGAVDYQDVLGRWTRSETIFDGLYSVAYLHATLHAPELRRAFLQRFPDAYGRGSEEARRLTLADPAAETHWEFFLSASTAKYQWNDLADEDSIWRITLRSDDGPEVDATVRAIPLNANLRVFYPYLTPFSNGYGLEFPLTTPEGAPLIGPETRQVVLRISSAIGATELTWRFDQEG